VIAALSIELEGEGFIDVGASAVTGRR
jgi:hypothetical protein